MMCTDQLVNALVITAFLAVVRFIRGMVKPPSDFPKNIPAVPFYAVVYGQWRGWDQEKTFKYFFREKAEKYGAVKMYWGMRWNILVTRPQYLVEMLKQDEVYEKSGNHEKIPYTVLSEYNGDNVISAGNEQWKKYRRVMTSSMLFPDLLPLRKNTEKVVARLSRAGLVAAEVSGNLQRYTLANIGECILGVDFRCLDEETLRFCNRLRYIKLEVFKPVFLLFPLLEKLPFRSRKQTRRAVRAFKQDYIELLMEARTAENMHRLGPRLAEAYEDGVLTEKQFQDNANIAMLAGHENPQLFLTSLIYVVAKHQHVQLLLYAESVQSHAAGVALADRPVLAAVILETLRMYPPLGQLVNRVTRRRVVLGRDIVIPAGVYVGYNNLATQRDKGVWGGDADLFLHTRWGSDMARINSNYSLAKSRLTLPAFHGRRRACLGEKYALAQARIFLDHFVRTFHVTLDPSWDERITTAGPIAPAGLRVKLEKRV